MDQILGCNESEKTMWWIEGKPEGLMKNVR